MADRLAERKIYSDRRHEAKRARTARWLPVEGRVKKGLCWGTDYPSQSKVLSSPLKCDSMRGAPHMATGDISQKSCGEEAEPKKSSPGGRCSQRAKSGPLREHYTSELALGPSLAILPPTLQRIAAVPGPSTPTHYHPCPGCLLCPKGPPLSPALGLSLAPSQS